MIKAIVLPDIITEKRKYPCLKIAKATHPHLHDLIVLFSNPGYGTTLSTTPPCTPGFYGKWDEDEFQPFEGQITLFNE